MSWFCDHRACISLGARTGTDTGCAGCRRVEERGFLWGTHTSSTLSVCADSWDTSSVCGHKPTTEAAIRCTPGLQENRCRAAPIGSLSCTLPGADATGSTTKKQPKQNQRKNEKQQYNIIKTEKRQNETTSRLATHDIATFRVNKNERLTTLFFHY